MTQRIDYQKLSTPGLRALGGGLHLHREFGPAQGADRPGVPARLTDQRLMLVSAWREAGDIFTDKEKAALQWAEAVTLISETHAPDEAFAAVSAQFQPKEISDLTLAIGVINTYNRLSIGFRRPPGGEPAA
jgi:hypothetical protein